jgi:hypothetical protein
MVGRIVAGRSLTFAGVGSIAGISSKAAGFIAGHRLSGGGGGGDYLLLRRLAGSNLGRSLQGCRFGACDYISLDCGSAKSAKASSSLLACI